MKTYNYNGETIRLTKANYAANDSLAIFVEYWDKNFEDFLPYMTATVCLVNEPTPEADCAYLDTNNHPGLDWFLIEEGIAKAESGIGFSGFCVYPLFRFLDTASISERA